MITTPKHYNVSYCDIIRKLATTRSTLFFNGSLCKLDFKALTVTNVSTLAVTRFKSIASLAAYVRSNKAPMLSEAITQAYLRVHAIGQGYTN